MTQAAPLHPSHQSRPHPAGVHATDGQDGHEFSGHLHNPVDAAIESRQSMRQFLPAPVPRALV
ncbi:MAG: hypothetical protein B7X59_15075, partial [Polaromonas sp. 39-63-203]